MKKSVKKERKYSIAFSHLCVVIDLFTMEFFSQCRQDFTRESPAIHHVFDYCVMCKRSIKRIRVFVFSSMLKLIKLKQLYTLNTCIYLYGLSKLNQQHLFLFCNHSFVIFTLSKAKILLFFETQY